MPDHRLEDHLTKTGKITQSSSKANMTRPKLQLHNQSSHARWSGAGGWLGSRGVVEWIDCCHHTKRIVRNEAPDL